MTFRLLHRVCEDGIIEEFPGADQQIDTGYIHVDHAARAHIHMANFAVPHLAFRQSNIRA